MIELDHEDAEQASLAEQLAETPPGPQLAALLTSLDRTDLDSDELLGIAQARRRFIAHQEAQLLADLHAVARKVPDYGPQPKRRDQCKYPWAEVEAAFALRWTYARAAGQLLFADEVIDRLPMVYHALDTGEIDIPKAQVLTEAVSSLEDPTAAAIVTKVIDQAPELTTGQLRAKLRRLVLAACPDLAVKKARAEIKDRRVAGYANPDNHLAALAGYELAPHRVAAVMERLDAVAKAAKAAGDGRSMDQLRADIYLDLLVGEGIAVGGQISDGDLPDAEAADYPDTPDDADDADHAGGIDDSHPDGGTDGHTYNGTGGSDGADHHGSAEVEDRGRVGGSGPADLDRGEIDTAGRDGRGDVGRPAVNDTGAGGGSGAREPATSNGGSGTGRRWSLRELILGETTTRAGRSAETTSVAESTGAARTRTVSTPGLAASTMMTVLAASIRQAAWSIPPIAVPVRLVPARVPPAVASRTLPCPRLPALG